MLTPLQYNHLCDEIAVLYAGLEESVIEDMTRRIVRMGYLSDASAWQARMLQESGMLYEDILAEISQRTGQTDREIRTLFQNAGVQAVRNDNFYYRQAGLVVPRNLSGNALQILEAGYQKCGGSLKNLTLTTANTSQQAFIQACNLAYMQTSSGVMDYNTAIRHAVRTAAGNGSLVRYPSGHTDKLDVAVRRAVLTGVGQTVRQVSFQNARDLDCDLMEITAHAGARPSHSVWQGKIVSLSGRRGYLTVDEIGYGTVDGFGGVNCRHDWHPFFEGFSERAYSDQRLKDLAEHTVQIDGKDYHDYEITQMQRYYERRIREKKRQVLAAKVQQDSAQTDADAAAAGAEFQKRSVQLKKAEQKLKDFLDQTGFLNDSSRTWVDGFGKSVSQKAVCANKKASKSNLTNSSGSGTIKSGSTSSKIMRDAKKILNKFSNVVDMHGAVVADNVDTVAKTLENLTYKYKINKLQVIQTDAKLKSLANSNYHVLNIQTDYINGKYDSRAWSDRVAKYQNSISEYKKKMKNSNNPTYKKLVKELIEELENVCKFNRFTVGDGGTYEEHLRATIIHEYGHVLADQRIGQINKKNAVANWQNDEIQKLNQKIIDSFEKAKKNGDIYNISEYASKNSAEFFAESFCAREIGEQLPNYIISMLDEVIGYEKM